MKKNYLLFCFLFVALTTFGQSFTGPTSVASGSKVTLTAVGESFNNDRSANFYYFTNVLGLYPDKITYPSYPANAQQYISISLLNGTTFFSPTNQTPTKVNVSVSNTYYDPITIKFNLTTQYAHGETSGAGGITGAVDIPYTITIQPVPGTPRPGTFARLIAKKASTFGGAAESPAYEIYVYFYKYSNATVPFTVTNLPVNFTRRFTRVTLTTNVSGDHAIINTLNNSSVARYNPNGIVNPTAADLGYVLAPGDYTIYY